MEYTSLTIDISENIAHIEINRPEKANALDENAFTEITHALGALDENEGVRVIILSGAGRHFCAGIDLSLLLGLEGHIKEACEGRKREKLRRLILRLQEPTNAVENCRKPVLMAVHGGCIGAGLDIAAACDMRFIVEDGYFCLKEIDMGMVADLGVLQRLPGIIPEGMVREMAYTGRKVFGPEATKIGLSNRTFPDKETMMEAVRKLAAEIASKSPLSIRGTKEILNYGRDHSISDGLNYIATWNAAMILSEDLTKAGQAAMMRTQPEFRG